MQIKETCKPIRDKLEESLLQIVPKDPKPLYEAARYILSGGGKRTRSMLVLLTAADLSVPLEKAIPVACALELIHNYSLVHDDLPCMDNDDYRRGKPTVHKAFDEATAVLLGDFLLTQSFATILENPQLSNDEKVELSQTLAHYSGGGQLLEGQMLDLSMEGKIGHYYDLLNIYLRKTSSLFCCALECAIKLGQSQDKSLLMRDVGQKIGLAFQIKNDLMGKKKDEEQQKFTIFALHTEKQAKLLIEKNVCDAIQLLDQDKQEFAHLKAFIRLVFEDEV